MAPLDPLIPPDLPPRRPDTHKGTYGTVVIAAGSVRYPGAAVLVALGAGRMGAGLVRLALAEPVVATVLPAVPFATVLRCPAGPGGGLAEAAGPVLEEALDAASALVLGPGLDTDPGTGSLVTGLLARTRLPVVLDADGLNLRVAAGVERLADRPGPTVLTPHPGEFARLDGGPVPRGDGPRAERSATLARRLGVTVVLKGHRTVVTDGERLSMETAGNPGMATGGMGDVLSGVIGALLARLDDPAGAAALGVALHARAGDLAAAELGEEAVLPEDVAVRLGRAARLRARERPTTAGADPVP